MGHENIQMSRDVGSEPAGLPVFGGVDGCRGGWFAAWTVAGGEGGAAAENARGTDGPVTPEGVRWRTGLFPHFAPLVQAVLNGSPPEALRLLVDMPIGLPSGSAPRRCDVDARRLLGPGRGSSVFPAPPRAVLEAGSWEEGLSLARASSGRGISLQAWHLVPKIREVDDLLRAERCWVGRIREAHPELLFRGLAMGGARAEGEPPPDLPPKRTREGFEARLGLLEAASPGIGAVVEGALGTHPRRVLARDDILDALVAAVVARLGGEVALQAVPDLPERDEEGLPMEIVIGVRPAAPGPQDCPGG